MFIVAGKYARHNWKDKVYPRCRPPSIHHWTARFTSPEAGSASPVVRAVLGCGVSSPETHIQHAAIHPDVGAAPPSIGAMGRCSVHLCAPPGNSSARAPQQARAASTWAPCRAPPSRAPRLAMLCPPMRIFKKPATINWFSIASKGAHHGKLNMSALVNRAYFP